MMINHKLDAKLRYLRSKGLSYAAISSAFIGQISTSTVWRRIGDGKRAIQKDQTTDKQVSDIMRMHAEGHSLRAIGKVVGVSHQTVDNILKKYRGRA